MLDSQIDEGLGQRLKLEAIVDGRLQSGRILRGDTLTLVGTVFPNLMLEVRASLGTGGAGTILSFEAAQFHGIKNGHLMEESRAFGEEGVMHEAIMSSR